MPSTVKRVTYIYSLALGFLDRFLRMHLITKATPIIIIKLHCSYRVHPCIQVRRYIYMHNYSHCRQKQFKEIICTVAKSWHATGLKWLQFDRPLDHLNLHKSNHDYEVLKDELFSESCWTNKHLKTLKLCHSTLNK